MNTSGTPAAWEFAFIVSVIMFSFLAALYLIPTLVAYKRQAENRGVIATINILTGWTGLGWIAALVWARTDQRYRPLPIRYGQPQALPAPPEHLDASP